MEEENEDNFDDISFMPRRHWLMKIAGICAAVVVLAGVMWVLAETNTNRNLTFQGNRRATDIRPRAANPLRESSYKDPASPVGTNGVLTSKAAEPSATGADAIQDLRSILGTDDPRSLAGRPVEITVPMLKEQNPTTFWIGSADDRLLVVLNRDTRNGGERQVSKASEHGIVSAHPGQHAVVTGTVQRVPRPEERASWDLTASQTRELERRGVYIRADRIATKGS